MLKLKFYVSGLLYPVMMRNTDFAMIIQDFESADAFRDKTLVFILFVDWSPLLAHGANIRIVQSAPYLPITINYVCPLRPH